MRAPSRARSRAGTSSCHSRRCRIRRTRPKSETRPKQPCVPSPQRVLIQSLIAEPVHIFGDRLCKRVIRLRAIRSDRHPSPQPLWPDHQTAMLFTPARSRSINRQRGSAIRRRVTGLALNHRPPLAASLPCPFAIDLSPPFGELRRRAGGTSDRPGRGANEGRPGVQMRGLRWMLD
jgi:hypothetical protein